MRIVAWALAAVVAAAVFFALATAGALWHFSSAPRAFEWKGDATRVVGAPLPFAVAGEAWLDWRGRAVEVDVTVRVAAVDLAGALGTRVVTGEIDRAAGGWLENARYRLTIGGEAASLRAVGGEIFFDAPFSGGADFNLDPQGRAGGIADAAFRSLRILAPGARATAGFAGRARGVVAAAGAGEDWRLAFDSLRLSLDFSRLQAGTVKPPFAINLIPFLGAAADSFAAVYAADFFAPRFWRAAADRKNRARARRAPRIGGLGAAGGDRNRIDRSGGLRFRRRRIVALRRENAGAAGRGGGLGELVVAADRAARRALPSGDYAVAVSVVLIIGAVGGGVFSLCREI